MFSEALFTWKVLESKVFLARASRLEALVSCMLVRGSAVGKLMLTSSSSKSTTWISKPVVLARGVNSGRPQVDCTL